MEDVNESISNQLRKFFPEVSGARHAERVPYVQRSRRENRHGRFRNQPHQDRNG